MTVTGPTTGITAVTFGLTDGTDTVTAAAAGAADLTFTTTGTLTVAGAVTTTGALTFVNPTTLTVNGSLTAGALSDPGVTAVNVNAPISVTTANVTATASVVLNANLSATTSAVISAADLTATATGMVTSPVITLTSANEIGTATNPLNTAGSTITANAGAGGVYLAEADGASVTATATGAGNVSITNATGTLNIAGATTTVTGNLSLSSGGAITLGANLNAGSGTITIAADTLGTIAAGTAAFDQMGASITTTNTTANALSITVNTASAGAGDAIIGQGSVGSNSGGTVTVNSNGGNILWSNDPSYTAFTSSQTGLSNGGSNTQTLHAFVYNLTSTAGIGADARPLQFDNYGLDGGVNTVNGVTVPNLVASAGAGGLYVTDWDSTNSHDLTIGTVTATGAGNVRIVTANATGHNQWIVGNVSAGSGYIYLASDDDIHVLPNAVIGGTGFSGSVWMSANRDVATNGQPIVFDPTASVVTSSTANQNVALASRTPTTQAVYMEIGGGTTGPGLVTVGNITTGDGGRVVLNGSNLASPTQTGKISMASATNVIDVGPTGTLELDAIGITALADTAGTAAVPIAVAGGNVVVNVQFGNVYVTGQSATNFAGGISLAAGETGAPVLNLATAAGPLTINGATGNVNGGTISLTSTGTGGGVAINAPLSSSTTGNITINAGTNAATLNSTLSLNSTQSLTVTATGGLTVGGTGVLSGTGVATNATPVAVQSGGTLSPNGAGVGTLNVGNVALGTGAVLRADLNSNTANDTLNVTGTIDVTGSTLALYVNGPLTVGTAFTLVSNDGTDPVIGQFAGGTTIAATNDPRYSFTLNYAGGDGNDIVATLTSFNPATILDVNNGVVTYLSAASVTNALTVSRAGGNYTFTDPSTTITLSANALAAGWTGNGTSTVTGPTTGVTSLALNLADGADGIAGIDAGTASVSITGTGSVNVSGAVSTSSTITVSGITDLSESGTGALQGTTVTLTTSNSIGTSVTPLAIQATTIVNSTGAGGVYEAVTGGANVTAAATGAGNVSIANTTGVLNVAGNVTTVSGNISLSSTDDITLNANVNAGSGTITLAANTDGAGTNSLTQATTGSAITTTNNSASAVTITVNTSSGGTGNASLRTIAATAGTLTVNSNGGSILYAGTDTLTASQSAATTLAPGITGPAAGGAAPTGAINALNYVLTATGAGSIGTAARPINASTPASNTELFNAGSGGIYFVDFGNPMTLNGATATGAGSVEVVAGNASGHNLVVAGNVTTGSGNIVLAADDDFTINASVTIGGAGFSGQVYLACNRDTGNTETLNALGSIITSNTSAAAVVIEGFHTANNGTNAGATIVNNVTVGNGGTIIVSTVPTSQPTGQGTILAANASSVLNAGPLGTVTFIASTMYGNATYTSAVGTAALPLTVTAGTVNISANSGTSAGNGTGTAGPADSVYVTDTIAGSFTATTGSVSPSGSINLTTTSGALTIAGSTSTGNSNAINLSGAGGVVVNSTLGGSATGAITIANSLSGTGTVGTGSNAVTLTGPLSPGTFGTTGILTVSNLTFGTGAAFYADLNSAAAGPGTGYDELNVTGTVNLTGVALNLIVPTTGLNVGDSFTLINNAANAVMGTFTNLSSSNTVAALNNPLYTFTINYAGGASGLNVIATLTNIASPGTLDVSNGVATYTAGLGMDNNVTLDMDGMGNYLLSDTANVPVILDQNAINSGWTVNGSGVATGPTSTATQWAFNLADGNDAFALLNAGFANVTVTGTGSLALNGDVTTAAFTVSQFGSVAGTGTITATSVSIVGANNLPLTFGR